MITLALALVALHLFANLLWIGSISVVAWLVLTASGRASSTPQPSGALELALGTDTRSAASHLARTIYLRFATPAFGASFLFGVARLAMDPSTYIHMHWFHAKLMAALGVIALHHVIGARAKRLAAGSMQVRGTSAILFGALLACVVLTCLFVIFRNELIG
ncbi:CopD family protein [Pendulispora brunnea]|uniref:CopD family protein n=1 Tax=Pendulispora brunnea TaxID=2905690 RepID=A0ABZ2KI55_9BACT